MLPPEIRHSEIASEAKMLLESPHLQSLQLVKPFEEKDHEMNEMTTSHEKKTLLIVTYLAVMHTYNEHLCYLTTVLVLYITQSGQQMVV